MSQGIALWRYVGCCVPSNKTKDSFLVEGEGEEKFAAKHAYAKADGVGPSATAKTLRSADLQFIAHSRSEPPWACSPRGPLLPAPRGGGKNFLESMLILGKPLHKADRQNNRDQCALEPDNFFGMSAIAKWPRGLRRPA